MIGSWELMVILFVILLLFGGKKLPEFAKNLGKGLFEFKKASQGFMDNTEVENSQVVNVQPNLYPQERAENLRNDAIVDFDPKNPNLNIKETSRTL